MSTPDMSPDDLSRMTQVVDSLIELGRSEIFNRDPEGIVSIEKIDTKDPDHQKLIALVTNVVIRNHAMSSESQAWFGDLLRGVFGFIQVQSIQRSGCGFTQLVIDADMRRAVREMDSEGC